MGIDYHWNDRWETNGKHIRDIQTYHLVMTNSSPWKDPPFFRTVNHLFRLGPSKNHGELLVITRLGMDKSIGMKSKPWPNPGDLCFFCISFSPSLSSAPFSSWVNWKASRPPPHHWPWGTCSHQRSSEHSLAALPRGACCRHLHMLWKRIHGAAIYGVPWIPSIYPLYVSIYTSTMDPMAMEK